MTDTTLRVLVDLRQNMQKQRIGFGNRLDALLREADTGDPRIEAVMRHWHITFADIEEKADANIRHAVRAYPIHDHITSVRGVGPLLAAQLIAAIDIRRADTISALWRYAGYAVFDGERERPRKGERRHYNANLKKTMYLIGSSFLRSGSPYRRIYDDARARYETDRPDWTKAHQHMAAIRRMNKEFLSHLWLTWRQLEGLPVSDPYVAMLPNHTHITTPADFGWPTAINEEQPNYIERAMTGR